MKKRLAIFGVIAALLMLAACSAAAPEYGTEQTQEQEQIVLHLFHYQGEAEDQLIVVRTIVFIISFIVIRAFVRICKSSVIQNCNSRIRVLVLPNGR